MSRFDGVEKVGIRAKGTNKLLAVYPHKVMGTDDEIINNVRDWYYQRSCAAEDQLLNAYVDVLTEKELKSITNTH